MPEKEARGESDSRRILFSALQSDWSTGSLVTFIGLWLYAGNKGGDPTGSLYDTGALDKTVKVKSEASKREELVNLSAA
ncbi:MAG TPA: hypothetical protein DEG06_03320 [Lachnospiraceae bacterium]|nr:hypothetical protein [Lachnospiraceae bacterium]